VQGMDYPVVDRKWHVLPLATMLAAAA
jgi:hypothetical protein